MRTFKSTFARTAQARLLDRQPFGLMALWVLSGKQNKSVAVIKTWKFLDGFISAFYYMAAKVCGLEGGWGRAPRLFVTNAFGQIRKW